MPDILTRLEDEMEALYDQKKEEISRAKHVVDWGDYLFRAGFMEAIREVGKIMKKIRSPGTSPDTGEIPHIFEQEEKTDV